MANIARNIDWRLNAAFQVIEPLFVGDSELVNISMSLEKIELTLVNRGAHEFHGGPTIEASTIKMVCEHPAFVSFQSDHLQNVIEDVFIFDRQHIDLAREMKDFSGKELFPRTFVGESNYYVFVTPKTGIDLFAAVKSIAFFDSKVD